MTVVPAGFSDGRRAPALLYLRHRLARFADSPEHGAEHILVAVEAGVTFLESISGPVCGHAAEVAAIAVLISRACGHSQAEQRRIKLGALLHDIGKAAGANAGRHAAAGAELINGVPGLPDVAEMVLLHHAWWKGRAASPWSGGPDMPCGACIIAAADAFQKIIAGNRRERVFLRRLWHQAGTRFDPAIISILRANWRGWARLVVS